MKYLKLNKILLMIFIINISCNKNESPKEFKTSYKTNDQIVGGFDRKKYSLIEEGITLKQNGEFKKAIEKFNLAEIEYGEMIQIYINRGVTYNQNNETEKSINDFTKCLKIDQNNFTALLNRSLALALKGDFENSNKDFNLLIELYKNRPEIYINRSVLYFLKKETKLGCDDLRMAKKLDKDHNYEEEISKLLIENCL
jgi:tetratricopeptide (TPR) repeat protein